MTRVDNIIVPRWFLEVVEDTLRIQNNINLDKETGETCQDRNIHQSLNGIRKLLNEEELTGMERLEKSQPSHPSDLDEAAEEYIKKGKYLPEAFVVRPAFIAGAEWQRKQDELLSKITEEHLEGLRWIIRTGITTQPRPYHKYCKDLLQLLESYKNEI